MPGPHMPGSCRAPTIGGHAKGGGAVLNVCAAAPLAEVLLLRVAGVAAGGRGSPRQSSDQEGSAVQGRQLLTK